MTVNDLIAAMISTCEASGLDPATTRVYVYFKASSPATMTLDTMTLEGRDEHGNPMSVELDLTADWTEVPGMRVAERITVPAMSGTVGPVIGPLDG